MTITMPRTIPLLLTALALGCGGEAEPTTMTPMEDAGMLPVDAGGPVEFTCSVDPAIDPARDFLMRPQDEGGCAASGCHGEGGFGSFADPMTLVDRPSRTGCGEAEARIIDPADPAMSLIYRKLREETLPCGSRMPLGGTALSDDERACMLEYLTFLTD